MKEMEEQEEKEEKKDRTKKSYPWLIGLVIVVIIILLLLFLPRNCSDNNKSGTKLSAQRDSLISAQRDSLVLIKARADSLQIAYNNCAGILTPEEKIAQLESEVSRLKKRKPMIRKTIIIRHPRTKTIAVRQPAEDVAEKSFTPAFTPQPVARVIKKEASTEDNPVLTEYAGVMKGDYGTTIDNGSGRIVYFIKNNFVRSNSGGEEAPRLNGRSGEKFSYNAKTGYWYYVDGQIMTASEINSWSYAREWNVFIGMVDYGTGSYEAYLPHQALKPLINQARGKEWGEITDEDLCQMRKLNSSIWTPNAEGTLRPFRLSKNGGRAYGKEDHQLYQGWNFRTRIVAIKK